MRVLTGRRIAAVAACAALLLAAAPPGKAIIGSILQIAQMGTLVSNTASLVREAEKRFDQLTETIGDIRGMKDRIEGEITSVGSIATQLGSGWRDLYADSAALLQDAMSLPSDLRDAHGDLFDSLTGTAGSSAPAAEWRAYTGTPVSVTDLAGTLGAAPGSPVAETLEASLGALQRTETLGTAVRQAVRSASETARSARAANARHREPAQLRNASQAALLQKILAAQLTQNELLASMAQVQGISAAAATLQAEERSRSRNAAAAALAASRSGLEAERARIQALQKAGAAETAVAGLYSLAWMTPGNSEN